MRLNIGFSNLSPDDLANQADVIFAALTGNASFPSPTPTLAVIAAATKALRSAIAAPEGPARAPAIEAASDALATLLQQLGQNLASTPGATPVTLATTGFKLPKTATRTTNPPPAPGNVRLSHGINPGEIAVHCDPADGARSYDVEWTFDANVGPWTDAGSFPSTRGIVLSGLTRGKDVWVHVRALGTAGNGPWSDPATLMVT